MKGGISAVSALILAFCLVFPISFAADGAISKLKGSCDSAGNAEISMIHTGGAIKISDIAITYVYPQTGSSKEIRGEWLMSQQPNPLYLSEENTGTVFRTTDSPLKKKGTYEIHFLFMQKKQDISLTDVGLAVDCPGVSCDSNNGCDFDSECSGGTCVPLFCRLDEFIEFNRCVSKCNDNNPCTIDVYKNGECKYERNMSSCCRNDEDCNLKKACSIDKCVSNKCEHKPVSCSAAASDKCVNALCIEPKGCVYETDETCLANENEKRDYLVVVGQPQVYREPLFSGFFRAIANFFRNLF